MRSRGDEQQAVAEVKDFADLAAFEFADAGQIELQQGFIWHGKSMKEERGGEKSKISDDA